MDILLLLPYLDTQTAIQVLQANKHFYSHCNEYFWTLRCKMDFQKPGNREDYISWYQQDLIIKKIEQKRNVFMTGPAGSGKSYMVKKIKELMPTIPITSSTGVSAFLIKGSTFHSFFGVGTGTLDKEKLFYKVVTRNDIRRKLININHLIIDEVSMLSPTLFEKVDYICQRLRKNNKAFGGIQLILVGDFFQLPPVKEEKFLFETQTWKNLNLFSVHFKKIYRQEDPYYISLLSKIRTGNFNKQDISGLKTRIRPCETEMPFIFSKKIEVHNLNLEKLNQIQEPFVQFPSKVGYQFLVKETPEIRKKMEDKLKELIRDIPFDDVFNVKKGARVMLKVNLDVETGLVNGAIGTVQQITPLLVKFDNGIEKIIAYHPFIHEEEEFLISIQVIPLLIAYAFTVHSIQGCTLERANIDISSCFDFGQAYVALSRVKSWDGLYLQDILPTKIKTSQKVVEFYNNL